MLLIADEWHWQLMSGTGSCVTSREVTSKTGLMSHSEIMGKAVRRKPITAGRAQSRLT